MLHTKMSTAWVVAVLGAALLIAPPISAQQLAPRNPLNIVPDKMPFDTPYGAPISLQQFIPFCDGGIPRWTSINFQVDNHVLEFCAMVTARRIGGSDGTRTRVRQNLGGYIRRVTTLVTTSAAAHSRLRLSHALRRTATPSLL